MQSMICLLRKDGSVYCQFQFCGPPLQLLWLRITATVCACTLSEPLWLWAGLTGMGSMSCLSGESEICFSSWEPLVLGEALFKHFWEICRQEQLVQIYY